MSKNVKTLLYIGIFILCMALVLVILVVTDSSGKSNNDTEEAVDDSIYLCNNDRDDIKSVVVSNSNSNGGFNIARDLKGLYIPELDGLQSSSAIINAAGNCAASITAKTVVEENAADLDKYGLGDETYVAKIDVTLSDGTEYTIYLGEITPDTSYRYARVGGETTVYTVLASRTGYFTYELSDFVSLTILEELSSTNTSPTIDWLTVTRKDLDYDVIFEDDTKNYASDEVSMASSQVMISPVYAYLDITNSNDIVYGLWGLTASTAECIFPTDEDFEEYGIADPYCTVYLEAELQVYDLKIGNVASYATDESGNETDEPAYYYGYFEGIDCIFTFAVDEIPWVTFMPIDILSSLMTSNYIYALDYIDIRIDNNEQVNYYFDLEGDVDEATLTGTLNRVSEIRLDDFKSLYQFMLKCPIDAICLEDPADDAKLLAYIEFARADGGGDTLELYDAGNNRVIVKLNGTTSFSQPRNYLNVLEENLKIYANGGSGDDMQEIW